MQLFRDTDIAVDLGTSKIAIFVRGEGVVAHEPACLAFRGDVFHARNVIAVGEQAHAMLDRTPRDVQVVRPIRDGIVEDATVASYLVQALIDKTSGRRRLSRCRFLLGTLFGASQIERRAFVQVGYELGSRHVKLIEEPVAAAVGAELPIDEPAANMIVDVGGGATEIVVVSMGQVVCGNSIRIGGESIDNAIVQYVKKHHHLAISSGSARHLKELLSNEVTGSCAPYFEVKGLDKISKLPSTATLRASEVHEAIEPVLQTILMSVKAVTEQLSPDLSASLIERGLVLAGGGAHIRFLDRMIADVTGIPVRTLAGPKQAVVRGLERMMPFYDSLRSAKSFC